MKKYIIICAIISIAVIAGCHDKTITQTNNKVQIPDANSVVIDSKADISVTGSPYNIDSLKITGDILSVFVNYGGGCKEHLFELISNGVYLKSSPAQINVCLKHTNNEDHCRELVMRELKFNISKLKYKSNKTVVIKLGDNLINYSTK